jgi:hypothetical protein
MKLKDMITLQEVELPNDLLWSDEFDWSPVESNQTYTLTGALVIESSVRQAGRPISLSADQDMAWVTRQTLSKLKNWAAIPARQFRLIFEYKTDTREFLVVFNHSKDPAKAKPVLGFPMHKDGDYFTVALNFIEIAA